MKAILFLSAPFRKYYAWANENHGRAACFFFLSVGLIGLGLLAENLHTPFIEVIITVVYCAVMLYPLFARLKKPTTF